MIAVSPNPLARADAAWRNRAAFRSPSRTRITLAENRLLDGEFFPVDRYSAIQSGNGARTISSGDRPAAHSYTFPESGWTDGGATI
ncbi:MAG TPA: hypothetical protein PKJ51_02235 [Methanothrix sp.]|nr:hypothetical protein [Methanothrix sp.]